ncbi:MAG TPA: radical SAM protein [Acidobacteriaceae bacterium]|nr:radical SAM protein [Acidobacteriaceae bacterium]
MPAEAEVAEPEPMSSPAVTNSHRLSKLPILLLNLHESCNCKCVMCDIWRRKDGRGIDVSLLERQRASIVRLGVRQVVLTGGEPLLHHDFEAICQYLKQCGVRIILLTTGLLLARRAEIVSKLIDEIIVSLDGPERVHDQVRQVNGAFRLVEEGVRALRQRRPDISVRARSTVQKINHALLRATVSAARDLSLDSISFLAADVTSQAFNRDLVWPVARQGQVVLTRGEVERLEEEVEALIRENAADIDSHYIVEPRPKLRQLVRRFREQLGDCPPRAPLCNAPWVSVVMEVDGALRPCFFHNKVGNASHQSLDEAINSEQAVQFRTSLNVDDNPTCQRCVCSLNYKGDL